MLTSTSYTFAATGAAIRFVIEKTGLVVSVPGPTFDLSAASLNFGNVTVGNSANQNVTVTNNGNTNALSITGVTPIAGYTVSPSGFPISLAPGASQVFTVTFTPTAPTTVSGNIAFAHNATGGTTNLAVTGTGTTAPVQGGNFEFRHPEVTRFDATNSYRDTIQLNNYVGSPLKAVQFHVVFNGLMRLRSVTRGTDVPAASYGFDYTIASGPVSANGESNDTLKAIIFGVGSNHILPGTYTNMMSFVYDVVNISDSVRYTSVSLRKVLGSLDSTSGNAQLNTYDSLSVKVLNRSSNYRGDVNGDDQVNILDLLDVVDHIIERRLLSGSAFTRADVAPWPTGDNLVNVQDLAVLQNIILTGRYPDGVVLTKPVGNNGGVNALAKGGNNHLSSTVDAKLVFYITSEGIAVRMQNNVAVKGIQLEFGDVPSVPEAMQISTIIGNGYHKLIESTLRVLLYNNAASLVEAGDRLVANIPFGIANPSAIDIDRTIVAGENNRSLNIEIEISDQSAPELPTEYALFQNYPNPFNPTTTVRFQVPVSGQVRVAIYNTLGQEVRSLFDGAMERGTRAVQFDGKDKNGNTLSSGMYLYRMTAGSFVSSKKMMFLK